MMFIKTILALTFATLALAAPSPQGGDLEPGLVDEILGSTFY
jgi:hypothetical protein